MTSPHPRELLAQLEQRARKRFGQNFLVDPGMAEAIVRGAQVRPGDRVVEIGPGLGQLTQALLAAGADLTAVELDRDLASWLRSRELGARIVEGDAARVDWEVVCPGTGWSVVANLPFNVGTVLTMQLLQHRHRFTRITVMLQKEVVDRLMSDPGGDAYGSLTVRSRVRARARRVIQVPSEAFHPRPKVDAAVVRLDPYPEPDFGAAGEEGFDRVVTAGFSQRRKTLLNALGAMYGRERTAAALEVAGVAPTLRAEKLDVGAWRAIAAALAVGPVP